MISAAGERDAVAVGVDDVGGALAECRSWGGPAGLMPASRSCVNVVGGGLEAEAGRSEAEKSETPARGAEVRTLQAGLEDRFGMRY